jgi:serine/threonine-protein kinase
VLDPGAVIEEKYRVVRRLGEGGTGAVFEALDLRLSRRVAVKVLPAERAKERTLVMRFEREAQAAANIDSNHVVKVFDLGDLPNGDRYMVMELLEGESLQARLGEGSRLTPLAIAKIVIPLLEGLAKVHEAGIIHRDLKPANIFLAHAGDDDDRVKLLDFGVCKMTEASGAKGDPATAVGTLLGTLGYMAPEQVEHGSKYLDGRADLYAVGVLLYRSVTGTVPYAASTLVDLMRQLREGHAPRVDALAGDVDEQFSAIVEKALEWDRTDRYATAKELQAALVGWVKSVGRIGEVLSDFLEARESSVPPPPSSTVARVALVARRVDPAPAPATKLVEDAIDIEVDTGEG